MSWGKLSLLARHAGKKSAFNEKETTVVTDWGQLCELRDRNCYHSSFSPAEKTAQPLQTNWANSHPAGA
jgi:hypothetical protein